MTWTIKRLGSDDAIHAGGLLSVFADAFEEPETYNRNRPDGAYLSALLADETFVALVALHDGQVVGGLTAYELKKPEQPRSEIFIYDLAVAEAHRRQGIATGLIRTVQRIAAECGAHVVVIQAEKGDEAPIALYSKLGTREEAVSFDLPVA